MYLKPFLVIQILAFLTTEIWAYLRLRAFGPAFMVKLEALASSGYIPIPLPHQMLNYLHIGSILKTGTFFTFSLGITLGVVAFGGAFCLTRFKFSRRIRLSWIVLVSALFSFLLGFSPVELLLLMGFFGLAHLAIKIPDAPFHKAALFSLIPLFLIYFAYHGQGFLAVRDHLLQNAWGKKVVDFYYWYSPLAAELITPPAERTQVTIWTDPPLEKTEKSWLLKRSVYPVSTRNGADLALSGDERKGPALLKVIRAEAPGQGVKRLRKTIFYSIFFSIPLAIMLLVVLVTDRLLSLSKYARMVVLLCIVFVAAFLIYRGLSQRAWKSTGTLQGERVEDIRRWALQAERTKDPQARERLLGLLDSSNPTVRLWAATALAYLPSKGNVEILKTMAQRDPTAIVRCKAILALSHQQGRRVIPFLEARLKGEEDWYVKHYLLRALRRLGWIG